MLFITLEFLFIQLCAHDLIYKNAAGSFGLGHGYSCKNVILMMQKYYLILCSYLMIGQITFISF